MFRDKIVEMELAAIARQSVCSFLNRESIYHCLSSDAAAAAVPLDFSASAAITAAAAAAAAAVCIESGFCTEAVCLPVCLPGQYNL